MRAAGRLKHDLPEYAERLDREIKMIQKMQFSGYFLIVWDFIRFARSKSIPVGPGRGSAAGSLVGYAMGITDIDPLQYGLLFERFLNPERISLPDIDIDFCMNRRGEVIQYVTEKYGREQVAQIITFNTMAARAAIKDVGRALDMSFADVERLTKLVPNVLNISLDDAMKAEPGFGELERKDPRVAEILQVALRLEGMARNCSVHAAGVVISPQPLKELVPLYRTNREEIVTQFDMSGLEKLQLLKMDFLGLTTLTLIDDALKLIEKRHGVRLVPEELPLDDPATYEIFSKALTSGIFQFESSGMRDILRRYHPEAHRGSHRAQRALPPRPPSGRHGGRLHRSQAGPQGGGLRPARAEGAARRDLRRDRLPGTGDADLQRGGGLLAGRGRYSAPRHGQEEGRGDGRAAPALHQGRAGASGFPQKKVEKIFDLMEQFAGYGFNKSHSAAYAYLAFVTAYLKAHYPVDFMAALLTSETGNTAKVVKYINECREMGITVLQPDVNASDWSFTPDDTAPNGKGIRFGLGAVKNLGPQRRRSHSRRAREAGPLPFHL